MIKKSKKVKQKIDKFKRKPKTVKTFEFNDEALKTEILAEAKKLHIALSTAEMITEKVVANVSEWAAKRTAVTLDDINRRVALEMAKYNKDLTYVYQNRGKII